MPVLDFLIGAIYADPNGNSAAGNSYVIFGSNVGFSSILELSDLDGSNGFTINGVTAGGWSSHSVSNAGDVNGDGFDDLIIGSPEATPNGITRAGISHVVFGREKPIFENGFD